MANTTETVFVEFVVKGEEGIESAQQTLERNGKIDKAAADQFKKTNTELQARQRIIESTNATIQQTAGKTTASVRDVEKAVNNMLKDFAAGMQEGVTESLKEFGTSITEVKKRLGLLKQDSPFEKLSKELNEARNRVLNITAAMEQLRRTGGVDTEQFAKLGQLLVQRTAEFERLQQTYDTVTDSVNRNKKANEDNADSVEVLSSAQEALAKKMLELKQRLTDTGKNNAFEKLGKSVTDARAKVLDISAKLAQLKKTGGVDSEQFRTLSAALIQSQAELKKLQVEYEGVTSAANVNAEETHDNADAQATLRQRLGQVRQEMEQLKLAGQDNTEQYRLLEEEAGKLKDTIGDVGAEINNAAANSRNLEGLISVAQGIAGGFAIAEGATALFGEQSEELNEVLLRVNSVMAILQGLQAVYAVVQKESAASTFLATIGQKLYNLAIGETVGLLRVLRVAFAATGIGAVILGLTLLIQYLTSASKATKQLAKDFTKFNLEAERDIDNLNAALKENGRTFDERIAQAKLEGKTRREINKLTVEAMLEERDGLRELENSMRSREAQARQILTQMATGEMKFNEVLADEAQKTITMFAEVGERRKQIASEIRINAIENLKQTRIETLQAAADGIEGQLALARKNSSKELDLAKQLARAQAAIELEEAGENLDKRLLIERKLQAQIKELDAEFARVRQAERIAAAENELLKIQQKSKAINSRISQEEIDAQKKVIREQARLELLQTGLNKNARLKIIEDSLNAQKQLQKDFNNQSARETLEDLISRNNAELANIKLTDKEKLNIQEENLIAQAQIEIDANVGLADKIKEIRGKLNEDLRALRLAALQKQLNDELSLEASRTGALRRASERIVADETKTLRVRIASINQLAALDIAANNSKLDALEESLRKGLISQQDYNVQYAALIDEQNKIVEDAELKKQLLQKKTLQDWILIALDAASEVLNIIQGFGQQQTEAEQARIDAQRTEIDELREAGAISEKEALARQKRLDQEERTLKRKQATRDKAIAIFQAIINTAAAVVKALATGGPVYAAIVAALGIAQIALISSKPIPRFGKGKKDSYQGWGQIGETGPELMEHDGDMYLAKKPSVVWIGKRDKVFNPKETVAMLEKNNMQPYIIKQAGSDYKSVYNTQIDYDKLGKVIAGNIPKTGLSVDENGFTEYMHYKNGFTKYLNNRRSY